MKRGTLNFLGRKNQSLFDTNVKIKDMDNMQLVLDAPAIPESGTASVRARPTVKHHASSDSFQGFAVPTPKVPVLPPAGEPKVNGLVHGAKWSNGSVMSVPDLVEGEIFIPPPPPMAPPPPPETVILPPPDFIGDLKPNPGGAKFPISSVQAPKPTSLAPTMEPDTASLKPPTMTAPKPPSTSSYTPISSPPPVAVPEHPKFAPPQPPIERQPKTFKTPPPKPIRMSSIPIMDSPPDTPAPPPSAQKSALSSFNPQNKAKIYDPPKTSFFGGIEDRDKKPKQMLLLEDTGSVNTPPVLVQVDGKVPKVATLPNPVPKDVEELKENVEISQPSQAPLPKLSKEPTPVIVPAQQETVKPLQTPLQTPTLIQEVPEDTRKTITPIHLEPSVDKFVGPPSQTRNFSPVLDRKLYSVKGSEPFRAREGPAASPLALLKAAKEREKLKLAKENTAKNNEQQSASIQPSDSSPNSFVVIPKAGPVAFITSQDRIQESSKLVVPVAQTQPIQTSIISSAPQVRSQVPSTTPTIGPSITQTTAAESKPVDYSSSKSQLAQPKDNIDGLNVPFLPPPPGFDDFDDEIGPPPSIRPPDPPVKKATLSPTSTFPKVPSKTPPASVVLPSPVPKPPASVPPPAPVSKPPTSVPPLSPVPKPPTSVPPLSPVPKPPASVPPPAPPLSLSTPAPVVKQTFSPPTPPPVPPPSPKPPAFPKLPAQNNNVKPNKQVQTSSQPAPTQIPSNLSASQATLLSILQKKMLEMDHKMGPVKQAESGGDDWNGPLSDEETKVSVVPKSVPQSKNVPGANKAAPLDMQELKSKVAKKNQQASSMKSPTSNGPSKHPFGKTFTIRPGTKQPITPVIKGESN